VLLSEIVVVIITGTEYRLQTGLISLAACRYILLEVMYDRFVVEKKYELSGDYYKWRNIKL